MGFAFYVFICMSTNLQPIPLGLIAIQPYISIKVGIYAELQDGDTTYQNEDFFNPPSIFIDGVLITYIDSSDRRYITYDPENKLITFNNGGVNDGEIVEIFL